MKYALINEENLYFCGAYQHQGELYDIVRPHPMFEKPHDRYSKSIKIWKTKKIAGNFLKNNLIRIVNLVDYKVVEFDENNPN